MVPMRSRLPRLQLIIFALAAVSAGCAGSQNASSNASPGPSAAPADNGGIPTLAPDPNLLSLHNGTIVGAYPTSLTNDPSDVVVHGPSFKDGTTGPWQFVFELPGVASLDRIAISLAAADQTPQSSVLVSISTQSADAGYHDVADVKAASGQADPVIQQLGNVAARWVRLTVDGPSARAFNSAVLYGALRPRPSGAAYEGLYVVRRQPYDHGDGHFDPVPLPSDVPLYLRVVGAAGSIGGQYCNAQIVGDSLPGSFDGRTWIPDHPAGSQLVVNDDGSVIAGDISGIPAVFARTSARPAFCGPRADGGDGRIRVLSLDPSQSFEQYPLGDYASNETDFTFARLAAGLFDASDLAGYDTVMLDGLCRPADVISKGELGALTDWVKNGHKLLLLPAGLCASADYTFLPYPMTATAIAKNAAGNALIEPVDDELGVRDPKDTQHFLDTRAWATSSNQLANADLVTTPAGHWCGHLFATDADNLDGFAQAYAPYGRGVIVFDGFDKSDNENAGYQRMRALELRANANGDFPCNADLGAAFAVGPGTLLTFTPGKARSVTIPMQFLPSGGWKGHVDLSVGGAFAGSVTPESIESAGEPRSFHANITIPAGAEASNYAELVTAQSGDQKTQAVVVFTNAQPLATQLDTGRHARVYAILFDGDSARLLPSSRVALSSLAKLLHAKPKWRLRIEVHVGSHYPKPQAGALSRDRARAIVDELVMRYHVKRANLSAVGAGASAEVASDATQTGRALNERVELIRQ
jgi:outer membrane protein OmpA-like peptidoglycan-associated protein